MSSILLYTAAFLAFAAGVAHSWLGERFILIRLFRRADLPQLFGSPTFTVRTLRFAWHLTTVAWWGFAMVLVVMANPPISPEALGVVVGVTFLVHAAVTFWASRGRHLAWLVFLAIGVLTIFATMA